MFNVILKSLREWNIENKIFGFTLDNASVNDKMVDSLSKNLKERNLLHHEGKMLHHRCAAHVLNLAVQDGLKAMKNVVDCIRESVRYVRSSQYRIEKFDEMLALVGLAGTKHPPLDMAHRWNSTYLMLDATIPLRAAFEALKDQEPSYQLLPSPDEWGMAQSICNLLKGFYSATNDISASNSPTSHLYFYEVWIVKQILEKEALSGNDTVKLMVKEMEKKWIKYFEESYRASCIPIVFDPRFMFEFVEFKLKAAFGVKANTYLQKVKKSLIVMFEEYSALLQGHNTDEGVESELGVENNPLADWDCHLSAKKTHKLNELERYLKEELFPREENFNILKWWSIHGSKYPILSVMARGVLAVQASTIASESAFSTGGRVISEHRCSLAPETVEAIMCLED